jgi:hypothetical protein
MKSLSLILLASATLFANGHGATLAPNDPTVSGNLKLWLTDAANNFSGGTWNDTSGNGNHATTVGTVNVAGAVTYGSPTLNLIATTIDQNSSAVAFAGNANDLLVAPGLNGGAGFGALTIFTVYNLTALSGTSNLTRPVGFGSISATQTLVGNVFNLAADPSIRKDNGNIGAGTYSAAHPTGTSFIRITRMDAGGVDEWFNSTTTLNPVLTNAGTAFTVAVDDFYLGDLRAGVTPVPGQGTAVAPSDFAISQVIVYTGALTDQQIADVNEWIQTPIPEPTGAALIALAFGLVGLRRRRG